MADEPVNPHLNQVVQIQIQPVDNGFLIQAVNVDGKNKSVRKVATSVEDVRKKVGEIAGTLYQAPATIDLPPSGPTGPQAAVGT